MLRNLFAEAGYEVVQATDGAAALATLETLSPALMTLDLDLPDVPGAAVLKRLRERPRLRSVCVVIISGQPNIPARARRLAHAVIRKPFDVGELLAIVRALAPSGPESAGG